MAPRLLLVLALWVGCSPCSGREVPTQPRVRCRASRYPVAVDCVWTLPASPHPTRPTAFIATYRLGVAARGESQPCLQLTPEATSCTVPDVQMFSMVPYILNVTAVQPQATSSTLVPFVPEHIIKPDPPEGVRLSPIPGQRLWVQWEPPRSWPFPETFSLKYWIRYKHHRSARFRQMNKHRSPPRTRTSVDEAVHRAHVPTVTMPTTHAHAPQCVHRASAHPSAASRSEAPAPAAPRTDPGDTMLREGTGHERPLGVGVHVRDRPDQAHPRTGWGSWVPRAGGDGWGETADEHMGSFWNHRMFWNQS
ncbi:interleukin-27 subunit beta isoform X2 [Suricata suricatta]|uniref:interleukin-27 subunit beta isoform X2 n=1 Tax=Suricata suricatta TaxID=37032 RepID=UPI00115602AA|nr:interleukin-27 subunit beta isoform X2 [Suricata suricatta]